MDCKLENPTLKHQNEFLAAVRRSQKLHRPWVSPPMDGAKFKAYLERYASPSNVGFFLRAEDGNLAGVINISEIVRGVFRSGYLSYYAFTPYEGRGYMKKALRNVISRAFGSLQLHRLEANIQPENEASLALIRGLGFRCEGFSPRYLKIGGRWRDHERWAITSEDWKR